MRLLKNSIALLTVIHTAMQNEAAPYAFVAESELKELSDKKLVDIDTSVKNEAGAVAVALSDAGKAEFAERQAKAAAPATPRAPVDPGSFTRERITAIPERPRGGAARTSIYPFDDLAAPDQSGFDSFVIPPTDARPNPHKTLVSTVSGATKRWRKVAEKDTSGSTVAREFMIVPHDMGDGKTGARVIRTK